jgi:hypothetical protein
MKSSFQSIGRAVLFVWRAILFVAALVILHYEFFVGPRHGQHPDPTIVIAAIGLGAACISLKWNWR